MLSRRVYMTMMLIAGAGALFAFGIMFGVGVVTAPPERKPDSVADRLATPDGVRRDPVQVGANRALTPIYPANPGSQADAATDMTETVRSPATTGSGERAPTDAAAGESNQARPADVTPDNVKTLTANRLQPAEPDDTAGIDAAADAKTEPESGPRTAILETSARCDVAACAAAYRSFRASDCTYQPYEGPRQLCENPRAAQSGPQDEPQQREAARDRDPAEERRSEDAELQSAIEAARELTEPPVTQDGLVPFAARSREPAPAACNVEACAQAYNSFDPADCTYQPYSGPRQLCTK